MNRANYLGRARIVRVLGVFVLLWFLHYFFFSGDSQPALNSSSRKAGKDGEPTWALIVASTKTEDTTWIKKNLPTVPSLVYTVDDPKSKFKVPENKGNEAMVYLTYIIDNYNSLPDVSVFIHAHKRAHSSDELLKDSMANQLKRLRLTKVTRDGYFNLRCNWDPGCPSWLNLHNSSASSPAVKADEIETMKTAWQDLLPAAPMPEWIAQPSGAQFAASRAKIQAVSLGVWKSWRDWLIKTPLTNDQSGRVWEYLWQYALTGQSTVCPQMDQCYCEGYGVCFTSATKFVVWRAWWREAQDWTMEYLQLKSEGRSARDLKDKIDARNDVLKLSLDEAMRWGDELRDRGEEHSHYGQRFTEEEEKAMYGS
jgi:hypothetical protein